MHGAGQGRAQVAHSARVSGVFEIGRRAPLKGGGAGTAGWGPGLCSSHSRGAQPASGRLWARWTGIQLGCSGAPGPPGAGHSCRLYPAAYSRAGCRRMDDSWDARVTGCSLAGGGCRASLAAASLAAAPLTATSLAAASLKAASLAAASLAVSKLEAESMTAASRAAAIAGGTLAWGGLAVGSLDRSRLAGSSLASGSIAWGGLAGSRLAGGRNAGSSIAGGGLGRQA